MREKLFTLTRSQRDDLWRRYKQTTDRRVAERLHAILLLDEGRSASDVSAILHLHPKTLKRWIKLFAASGVEGLCTFQYVGGDGWLYMIGVYQDEVRRTAEGWRFARRSQTTILEQPLSGGAARACHADRPQRRR